MTIRHLDRLLSPTSVAVFGASNRHGSVGATVWRNLRAGRFAGPIHAVNPKHSSLDGVPVFSKAADLPAAPDLALLCTPAHTVAQLVAELGALGTRAVVIVTAGLSAAQKQAALDAARPHLMRLLGPNCIGLLSPHVGLNASFAHTDALPGEMAFVSQSGALVTAVLDWAKSRSIGLSHLVSLGDHCDVDFGDLLDYLASDARTRSILLYVESVESPRKFMSAARAAARNKPVIVVKAGRAGNGVQAAASHTGALAGSDIVYDAAIRRAGMLRVDTLQDLFIAAETLARFRGNRSESLTIMTNGGGAGVMAADAAARAGIALAEPGDALLERLNAVLPANWSHANPIDIIGDAPVERYTDTLSALLADESARRRAVRPCADRDRAQRRHRPRLPAPAAHERATRPELLARRCRPSPRRASCSSEAGVPDYRDAGGSRARLRDAHDLPAQPGHPDGSAERPARTRRPTSPRRGASSMPCSPMVANGLTKHEAKAVLKAYGIPVVPTLAVAAVGASRLCGREGSRLPGGAEDRVARHHAQVRRGRRAAGPARPGRAATTPSARCCRRCAAQGPMRTSTASPCSRWCGGAHAQEAHRRRQHRPRVRAGHPVRPGRHRGRGDRPTARSPCRRSTAPGARAGVAHARVAAAGRLPRPSARADGRPLRRADRGVADARRPAASWPSSTSIRCWPTRTARWRSTHASASRAGRWPGAERFAILPYPSRTGRRRVTWNGRTITLRPIRPEDEAQHRALPGTARARKTSACASSSTRRELPRSELARLTQIDYDREMAFIAEAPTREGMPETLGVARTVSDPDNVEAEFAIIVRSDLKGGGLGKLLFDQLIEHARNRGIGRLVGFVLRENTRMLKLSRALGFEADPAEPDSSGVRRMVKNLQAAASGA